MTRNLVLGLICRNERPMLELIQPTLAPYPFLDRLALDTGSTDGSQEVLRRHGFTVGQYRWRHDFSHARNELLNLARSLHPDAWLLMLDADETMTHDDLNTLEARSLYLDKPLITLPRYNLLARATLRETGSYPDKQARCLRLGAPLEFRNAVHEVVYFKGLVESVTQRAKDDFNARCHIYHYGWCKPPLTSQQRSLIYAAITAGAPLAEPPALPPITEEAFVADLRTRHRLEPFHQPHPLAAHYANSNL